MEKNEINDIIRKMANTNAARPVMKFIFSLLNILLMPNTLPNEYVLLFFFLATIFYFDE